MKKIKESKINERDISGYFSRYKERIGSPTLWKYVFPIYNCLEDKDGNSKITGISGTTFYMGNSYFMTASHVLEYNKIYNNVQQIGYLNQISSGCVAIYKFEVVQRYPEKDIAIIKCDELINQKIKPEPFHWHHSGLKYYQTIRAKGYPSGYDAAKEYTNPRAFSGTRVGSVRYQRNDIDAECYELSFHCLRGLSGTCMVDSGYQIHGVIIGNSKEELNYFDEIEEEIIEKDGQTEELLL